MQDRVLGMLGIAVHAGKVVSGGFSCEKAIKEGKAFAVILATDAQKNTVKTITDKCAYRGIALRKYGTMEELGHAIGKQDRACVALTDERLAQAVLAKIELAEKEPGQL